MDRLAGIKVPTLVLAGRFDFLFPSEHQAILADRIPAAQLEIIERAGHSAHEERAAEVIGIVRRFVAAHARIVVRPSRLTGATFRLCAPAGVLPTVRPSAYGIVSDHRGRLLSSTPRALSSRRSSDVNEAPEATVVRKREECGLKIHVGHWRRVAIEHGFSSAEQKQFEKRNTFCDAILSGSGAAGEPDHVLEWMAPDDSGGTPGAGESSMGSQ
jgi:hypothetical protein